MKSLLPAAALLFFPFTLPAEQSPDSTSTPILFAGKEAKAVAIAIGKEESLRPLAEQLQHYLFKSTGKEPAITTSAAEPETMTIRLSRDANERLLDEEARALGEEGFLLSTESDSEVVIWGTGEVGVRYGVYEFLERYLGIRWLFPGELGEEIPRHEALSLPRERILQKPVFLTRRLSPLFWNGDFFANGTQWGERNRLRGNLEFTHNLYKIYPPQKFTKTNPDFYAFVNGKRIVPNPKTDTRGYNWQPNFAAPGIVDAAVAHIDRHFSKHPLSDSFSLGINDAHEFDESPDSRARRSGRKNALGLEDVSDDYFLWANEVAEKVTAKHPGKWFGTLAYTHVFDPPSKVEVHPQIVPFLTFDRMQWVNAALREEDQARTSAWEKAAPTLGWYDYTYGSWYRLPRVYPRLMQQYLSWAAEHHVKHYYSEAYPNWAGEGPKVWLQAKLLWNPFQDVEALLEDWCRNAVGEKAGPYLAEYYRLWERFWVEQAGSSDWMKSGRTFCDFANPGYLSLVSARQLADADALLRKVGDALETPRQRARFERFSAMWDYYRIGVETWQAEQEGRHRPPGDVDEVLQALTRAEESLGAAYYRWTLMPTFTNDDWQPVRFFFNARWARPDDLTWGTSLLWSARPWLEKSRFIKERVQQMARDGKPGAREQAQILLAVAEGKGEPLLKNDTFRRHSAPWRVAHRVAGQAEAKALPADDGKPDSGGLEISGAMHTTISQTVPWEAGLYYAIVRFKVPEHAKAPASSQVSFTPSDGQKGPADFGLLLPTMDLSWGESLAVPGEEREILLPLHLPPMTNPDRRLTVALRTISRDPEAAIVIRQLQLHRIPDAQAAPFTPPTMRSPTLPPQNAEIQRSLLIEPKAKGAAVISVQSCYPSATGDELLQYYTELVASDTTGNAYQRTSLDNGATWGPSAAAFEPQPADGGIYRRGENALLPVYEQGTIIRFFNWSLYPEGNHHAASVMKHTRIMYELSRDGGKTFGEARNLIIKGHTPDRWAPDVEYGRNSMMISFSAPFLSRAGEIILPAQLIRSVPAGVSAYQIPLEAVSLRGKWTGDGELEWEMGKPLSIDLQLSSRGLCEPSIAELSDGRWLMIARGSNARLGNTPARKWKSVSTDGGKHWSPPEPLGFEDGRLFYSPSTGSTLIRSSRTGKLYWIGNISPENAQGNGPRHPLVIAEVDEASLTLKERTIRPIDTRHPEDSEKLELSNFRVYEDRSSGEFVLTMARLYSDPENLASPAYQYRIAP